MPYFIEDPEVLWYYEHPIKCISDSRQKVMKVFLKQSPGATGTDQVIHKDGGEVPARSRRGQSRSQLDGMHGLPRRSLDADSHNYLG